MKNCRGILVVEVAVLLSISTSVPGSAQATSSRAKLSEPFQPIQLQLDKYYYTTEDSNIQAGVRMETADIVGSICLRIRRDPNADSLAEEKSILGAGKSDYPFTFDPGKLPLGRMLVTADLLDKAGKKLFTACRVIYKKEMRPVVPQWDRVEKVSVREDGVLLVNGSPFCPFFASEGPHEGSPLVRDCFNVTYSGLGYTARPLKRVDIDIGGWTTEEGTELYNKWPGETELRKRIRETVSANISDPLLFSWFTSYEAQIPMFRKEEDTRTRLDNPAELKKASDIVKGMDPNHLTVIELDDMNVLHSYKDAADIIEVASWHSSYAEQLIPNLARDVDRIGKDLGAGKPFLFWIGASIPRESSRTADDIRCASYLALMHGAKGLVFHMGHAGIALTSTRHWSVYSGLAREVDRLFPILIEPQPPAPPAVSVKGAEIDFCVREYQGATYIIACNTADRLVKASFGFRQHTAAKTVELPFENRKVQFKGAGLTDYFGPYEPHLYKLSGLGSK